MTKLEYLKQLEAGLREKMSEQEIYDIMRDYAEYFEEGKTEGKTEEEIISSLGSPSYVVSQILCEQENPEMRAESDDIIGAAKEKFKRIKLRMEENKKYNDQKRKEKQKYKENVNCSGEYRSYSRPKRQKTYSDTSFLKAVVSIMLWFFIIIPFTIFIFSTGGGLVALAVAAVFGLAVVSTFVLPITTTVGILGIITLLLGGITVLLLGVIFFRFCIKMTFLNGRQEQEKIFEERNFEESSQQTQENIENGDEFNA